MEEADDVDTVTCGCFVTVWLVQCVKMGFPSEANGQAGHAGRNGLRERLRTYSLWFDVFTLESLLNSQRL